MPWVSARTKLLEMIESLQNEKVKYVTRLLTDNRFRKKSGVFVVEGRQENERAQQFGYESVEFFVCPEIYGNEAPAEKIHEVSQKVYEKIAYRGTSEGIVGIYKVKENQLADFQPEENSTLIIVEGVEKPGNLGAILRSCEAFGIDALIVTDPRADFYNPNVLRSSVGCLFGMNFFAERNEATLDFLQKNNYKVYSTYMSERSEDLQQQNFTQKSAILFGTEHDGLSSFWLENSKNILIPMAGTIDSINLSNAVAITCYEVLRQKKA